MKGLGGAGPVRHEARLAWAQLDRFIMIHLRIVRTLPWEPGLPLQPCAALHTAVPAVVL